MQQTFQLTSSNYHSNEANQHYMSVSQFKSMVECEAKALAELKGGFTRPHSTALSVGSYFHAALESDEAFATYLDEHHDSIFKSRGGKYSDYETADSMIAAVKNDAFCMFALDGEKEVIYTGSIGGVEWKIKVDSINHQRGTFADLKSTQELYKRFWSEKYDGWVSFVQAYDYILQMYIYREIIAQNTGRYYDPYIVAVTKQSPPDKAVLYIDKERYVFEEDYVLELLPSVLEAKQGERAPKRCEKCAYCRSTKMLQGTREIGSLLE